MRMSEKEWQEFAKKTGRDVNTGEKKKVGNKNGYTTMTQEEFEDYEKRGLKQIKKQAREKDLQDIFREIETGGEIKTKDIANNTNLTGKDKVMIREYQIKKQEWESLKSSEQKERARSIAAQNRRLAEQDARTYKEGFGNYQARDYVGHVIHATGQVVIRKPFNKSGLRNVFQSRGYIDRDSGMPAADYKNMTTNLVKGRVRGTLDIGGSSKKVSKNGLTPSIVPNLGYILSAPSNSQIGSGQVIMPVVGMLKFKKRGGKFQRNDFWL